MHLISLLIIPLNILFIVYVTSAVSGNQQNSCPKYNRFQKADGTYYQTLTHVCCPDYREVNDICIACDPGYYGQNCSHKCVSGNYGQGCKLTCQCNSQQTCHHMDGCVCKAGLMGPGCKQVCEEGRFGERCREHCQCSKNSECNHVTGDCKCDPGYDGRTCHDHCSYPKYGPNCDHNCYCPKHNSCHPVTGECACPAGFNGNDCTTKCPEGTFGVDCEGKCGCSSGSCDFISGKCTCFPGYSGRFCNDECLDGFYGDQCQHPCNCTVDKLCHHVTGECHCLAGKSGPDCTENNEDSSTTGIVIGVVFALFIPTVTAVVLCYLYQRNYLKCLQDSKHNQAYDDDSIHYEDIEDYAEIPESKMIQNYPYSYADADSVAPPVKPREPTRTKATNPYLSLPDANRLSKLTAGSEEKSGRKNKDLSKDFTDLLRKNKCESHQGFDKDRIGSTVSVESISGYLKPSFQRKKSNKFHRRRANVMTNRNGYWEEDGKGENDERGSYIEISLDKKVDENDFENKHSNIAESS